MCRLFWNLGASTSWNPLGLTRPVMGLLYLYSVIIPSLLRTISFIYITDAILTMLTIDSTLITDLTPRVGHVFHKTLGLNVGHDRDCNCFFDWRRVNNILFLNGDRLPGWISFRRYHFWSAWSDLLISSCREFSTYPRRYEAVFISLKCVSSFIALTDFSCNNYENNQQDALYRLIYYSKSTLHVSGDVFAHH